MKKVFVSRAAIIGVFILLGLVILVTAVFTIGTQQQAFVKTVEIKVIFEDVSGLQPGNNVWLSGVKIGTVKKMSFRENAAVEIIMSVDKAADLHIPKDAKAKISSDGFIGNKIVIIYGGTPQAQHISNGEYLQSEKSISTDEVLSVLQENNKNLVDITGNLKSISKKIKEGSGSLGEIINDPSIANELYSTISHFKNASINSEHAVSKINEFVSGFNKEGGLANELVTDTIVFTNLKKTIEQLNRASAGISDFAENVRLAGQSLTKTDNPAGTLLNDPQVASDLKNITRNLNTSSEKLDEDLKALQHNIFLRGYFRKMEKHRNKADTSNQNSPEK